MYKLTYKGQFVDGFDEDQVVGNLAQLLNLKPKAVRLAFLSDRPSVIKMLDSASEVERWCAAFQEAGVYLDVVGVDSRDIDSIANQIELELELHELDAEDDEPEERRYLIRKVVIPEPDAEPQAYAGQPLAARPVRDYVAAPTPSIAKVSATAAVNGEAPNIHKKRVNGSHPNGEPNGSHQSVMGTENPIEIAAPTPGKAKAKPTPPIAPDTAVHALSVAQIDALAAAQPPFGEDAGDAEPEPAADLAQPPVKPADVIKAGVPASATGNLQPEATSAQTVSAEPYADKLLETRHREDRVDEEHLDIYDEDMPDAGHQALDDVHPEEDAEEELLEDVNFHKSHFVWGMLVILLAIAATAGTILWLKRSTWAPVTLAPQEAKITEAIASASLFGLVHADVDRLQLLSPATDVFAQMAEPKPGFWQGLAQSGIDLKQQVDDVWLGAYGQNGQTKTMWVLHGNFATDNWREWLKKNYIIDGDSPEGLIFSTMDETSCEKSPVLSASISNNRVVLGAPELVAAFNGRIQAGAAAEKNLETWAKGYNTQMISAVLFHPGQLPEGTAAMALGKLSLPAEPIQGIYLGLEPKTFPPTVEFNAIIESKNPQFIADASRKLTAATAAAKTTITTDWPETLPIYEHIKIAQEAGVVRATLNLDEQAPQQLQLWISSLLSRAFATNDSPPAIAEERLETNPTQFSSLPSAELPAFSSVKHFNEAFIAQTSSGPFGIGIRTLEQTDRGVEINLDVNAFNLPNLGKESDSVAMRITDIVDHQDKSLLADIGGCGGGVKSPASINLVYQGNAMENGQVLSFTGLQGAKKIMLPAGMALSSVGAVKGIISHQLPIDVQRVTINGPLAGKTLELHGVELRFLSAGPSRLYFQVTGNTAALLQVNALNEDGKILANNNAMRSDNIIGAGKTISIDYQGTIAAAEVIVASKVEQKNYEFSIARIFPPAKPFLTEKPEPKHLNAASLPALEKDSPPNDVVYPYQTPKQTIAAGPALIALNDLAINGQHFSLVADVYTRSSHPLAGQLSTVRLVISEIEDSAGNLHSVNYQTPVAMEHMGGSWVDGKFEPDPNRPWLRGPLEMRDLPLAQSDAVALWGKLVFLATEDPVPIKVPFQFGMQWNNNDGVLKLRRWEAGRLIFDVEGNFPGLMAVKALDDAGAVVSQPAELRSNFGKKTIELEVKQIPETIEFNLARTQNPKEFPLEIRVLQ